MRPSQLTVAALTCDGVLHVMWTTPSKIAGTFTWVHAPPVPLSGKRASQAGMGDKGAEAAAFWPSASTKPDPDGFFKKEEDEGADGSWMGMLNASPTASPIQDAAAPMQGTMQLQMQDASDLAVACIGPGMWGEIIVACAPRPSNASGTGVLRGGSVAGSGMGGGDIPRLLVYSISGNPMVAAYMHNAAGNGTASNAAPSSSTGVKAVHQALQSVKQADLLLPLGLTITSCMVGHASSILRVYAACTASPAAVPLLDPAVPPCTGQYIFVFREGCVLQGPGSTAAGPCSQWSQETSLELQSTTSAVQSNTIGTIAQEGGITDSTHMGSSSAVVQNHQACEVRLGMSPDGSKLLAAAGPTVHVFSTEPTAVQPVQSVLNGMTLPDQAAMTLPLLSRTSAVQGPQTAVQSLPGGVQTGYALLGNGGLVVSSAPDLLPSVGACLSGHAACLAMVAAGQGAHVLQVRAYVCMLVAHWFNVWVICMHSNAASDGGPGTGQQHKAMDGYAIR